MPYPEFIELFDSGSGGLTTGDKGTLEREVTLKWLVSEKAGYLEAEAWAVEKAPLYYSGHRRTRLDIRGLGNYWWEVSANYTNQAIQSEEQGPDSSSSDSGGSGVSNTVSFDTTGGTEHITQVNTKNNVGKTGVSGQLSYAAGGGIGPDLEGAINVEGDQVRGVDVTVPVFNFSETWIFPSQYVVASFIGTLYSLTGTINNKPWRVFDTGEVLFLGARGEITRGASSCSITFAFAARPTVTGITVGDIGNIDKGGWDYLHVVYDTVAAAGSIIKRPKYVYVNSVYEGKDFTDLQIGNVFPAVYQPRQGFSN